MKKNEEKEQKEEIINNQNKSKNLFENLKNDYFIKLLFNTVHERKSLEIIKYNNKIKKRLNININNYKECCEKYSSIEIELTIAENKHGIFINSASDYVHKFFDEDKKEINRNILYKDDKVKMIKIIIDYQVESFAGLFYKCECIESIKFKNFIEIILLI